MNDSFIIIVTKIAVLIAALILTLLPVAVKIHNYKNIYEPRTALLHSAHMKNYSYAMIGDSAFCSYYVNNNSDTIWSKFESITGNKMFPGALNAAKINDIISAAEYISNKLPAKSTVFVDIIPTRFMTSEINTENNYKQHFTYLLLENNSLLFNYLNYMDLNYYNYVPKLLKNDGDYDLNTNRHYNRVWNVDGDFAKNRYITFEQNQHPFASNEAMRIFKEINTIFSKRNINSIFVIMPLNKQLIFTYSDISHADDIYSKLNDIHVKTKKYLREINASTLDLFESVPTNCFADLVHTNTCGDEIIARSMASYVSNLNGISESIMNKQTTRK